MDKKILYVNDFLYGGGAEKVFYDTSNLMREHCIVETFFATENITKPNSIFDYIYSKEYYSKFMHKLKLFKPDIIHLHNFYHKLSPSILDAIREYRKEYEVKVVMTTHDFHIVSPNSGYTYFNWITNKLNRVEGKNKIFDFIFRKWDYRGIHYSIVKQLQWAYNYFYKKLYKEIDIFISPSQFLADIIKSRYPKKEVYVVRNPISFQIDKSLIKKNNKIKKIVFAGRLSSEKGLKDFLYRLHRLHGLSSNSFVFYICGDGNEKTILESIVKKLKLNEKVFFLGYKSSDELKNILYESDCLVLPSLGYENAPLSLVEGALLKNKLLTMSYGGMGETARICGNYVFIDKSNDDELISFIKSDSFTENKELYNLFSIEHYIENLKKVYNI